MQIILASSSPRRKELLSKLVDQFQIIPSTCPEQCSSTLPTDYVQQLARQKATDVFVRHSDALVIGCDTVVDLNNQIMGKPVDYADAIRMLQSMSGKTHYVHTGCCILYGNKEWSFCDSTAVTFRNLTQSEIDCYVQSGAPMDKAGAYGIQECGFVSSYQGSYDNVVGFPTEKVQQILQQINKG